MGQTDNTEIEPREKGGKRYRLLNKKVALYLTAIVVAILMVIGGAYGYLYMSTPEHIRKPTYQHYHFRIQILVDGQTVDFSKDDFQVETGISTACSAAVSGVPIGFHDKIDQLAHIHWNGITGGEFLKYFGWNFIGGSDGVLGWRFDTGVMPQLVKIHGKLLPSLPDQANFFIYVGDKNGYQYKSWKDFLNQNLEIFFEKKSNIRHSEEVSSNTIFDWLFSKVHAHGGLMDKHTSSESDEELAHINNVIGNVVIFVQEKEPTKEQIKARFDNFVPLHDSTCGD